MKSEREALSQGREKTRRNFLKIAISVSALLLVGGIAAIIKSITNPAPSQNQNTGPTAFPRVKVAQLSDLQANQPVLFNYPLDNEPNILVKLGQKAEARHRSRWRHRCLQCPLSTLRLRLSFQATGTSPKCNSWYMRLHRLDTVVVTEAFSISSITHRSYLAPRPDNNRKSS